MSTTLTFPVSLVLEHCCRCGIAFGMTADWRQRRRDDGNWFYCPAGHQQHFTKPTVAVLRERAEQAERERDEARAHAARAQGERRMAHARESAERQKRQRLQARVAMGVCPDCKRSFTDLRRHMATKHGARSKLACDGVPS